MSYADLLNAPGMIERFFRHVDTLGPVAPGMTTRCHLWTGKLLPKSGYGRMTVLVKSRRAHRLAWLIKHGNIPDGLDVCHMCDVRHCVNIDHLFLGTVADNNADKVRKKRHTFGIAHPSAKLTDADVVEIISLRKAGHGMRPLADLFGVNSGTICHIVHGQRWRLAGAT